MNKLLIIIVLISFCAPAQDFKFGNVSKEELQEVYNPADSTANATYLYKYRRTYFEYVKDKGFVLKTEIHERIKIYNQEGFDYATKKVRLYNENNSSEKITGLKAYTYNLESGSIEDSKLKRNAIFETEVSDFLDETTFTMPNVKGGCVIEYKYEIMSPFVTNVDEFILQADIPIKKLDASFEVPEYFNYKVNTKGYLNVVPNSSRKRGSITFSNRTRSDRGGFSTVSSNVSYSKTDFSINISEYQLENIPALRDEPFVNNINNYRSAIKYELSYTQFPNSTLEYYSTTWEDVVKKIYESENFGGELDKKSYFKKDLDELLTNATSPSDKAALIFNYVKNRVKWNGFYGKYVNTGVKKAYNDQVGNVAEINLMLTAMLRYVGLNANPVLVSTRNNGIPLFPTREGYNYVIAAVEGNGQVTLLDATSAYSIPNILPFRTLNWEGRIIREHGSSALVNLYPNTKAVTKKFMNYTIGEDGMVTGKVREIRTKHDAIAYNMKFYTTGRDKFLEKYENDHGGIEVSDFEVQNDPNSSKPVITNLSFSADSQYETIGDNIYINPMLFFAQSENPFKLDNRDFPIDFGYPYEKVHQITINIPEGYKVSSLPESIALALGDNLGSLKFVVNQNGPHIQLLVDYVMNASVLSSEYYEGLKDYYSKLVEKETEKIVLTKA